MVDALREAHRVLTPSGVLIDVRPVAAPIVMEVVIAGEAVWTQAYDAYSAQADVEAADAAVGRVLSSEWLVFETRSPFDFEIYSDSGDDLRAYFETHKLSGAEIPYEELEERRRASGTEGQTARLRCRRPWMLTRYRKLRRAGVTFSV
jgi:hypothetical protein